MSVLDINISETTKVAEDIQNIHKTLYEYEMYANGNSPRPADRFGRPLDVGDLVAWIHISNVNSAINETPAIVVEITANGSIVILHKDRWGIKPDSPLYTQTTWATQVITLQKHFCDPMVAFDLYDQVIIERNVKVGKYMPIFKTPTITPPKHIIR